MPEAMFELRICPVCNKDCLIVRDSRKKDMCIKRKRECMNCGHIIRSTEITDDYFDKLQKAQSMMEKIKKFIEIMEGEKA